MTNTAIHSHITIFTVVIIALLVGCTTQPTQSPTIAPTYIPSPTAIEPTLTVEKPNIQPQATPTRTMPIIPIEKIVPTGLFFLERCIPQNQPCTDRLHYFDQGGGEHVFDIPGENLVISHNQKFATYENGGDLWLIDLQTGINKSLTNSQDYFETNVTWSPDDKKIAYLANKHNIWSDVYILDLTTGDINNISNTPDRIEYCLLTPTSGGSNCQFGWWAGHDDWIIVNSGTPRELNSAHPFGAACHTIDKVCTGLPTIISTNGKSYQIIDQIDGVEYLPDLSLDGRTLIYDGGVLYNLQTKSKNKIDPEDYDIPVQSVWNTESKQLVAPLMSPDEKMVAWIGRINSDGLYGLCVFDIVNHIGQVLVSYKPYFATLTQPARERWNIPAFSWSPDGEWIFVAAQTWGHETTEFNHSFGQDDAVMWVIKKDGSIKKIIGLGDVYYHEAPAWSPDSSSIIFTQHYYGPTLYPSPTYMLHLSDWSVTKLPIPDFSYPIVWADME